MTSNIPSGSGKYNRLPHFRAPVNNLSDNKLQWQVADRSRRETANEEKNGRPSRGRVAGRNMYE